MKRAKYSNEQQIFDIRFLAALLHGVHKFKLSFGRTLTNLIYFHDSLFDIWMSILLRMGKKVQRWNCNGSTFHEHLNNNFPLRKYCYQNRLFSSCPQAIKYSSIRNASRTCWKKVHAVYVILGLWTFVTCAFLFSSSSFAHKSSHLAWKTPVKFSFALR